MTCRTVAGFTTDEDSRRSLIDAARTAWASIGRQDLVAELDDEFGDVD
jgi:hypothetical protein